MGIHQNKIQNAGSLDCPYSKCNCNIKSKIDGNCFFGNDMFRKYFIIHKIMRKICEHEYIGNAQYYFKARAGYHFSKVWKFAHAKDNSYI